MDLLQCNAMHIAHCMEMDRLREEILTSIYQKIVDDSWSDNSKKIVRIRILTTFNMVVKCMGWEIITQEDAEETILNFVNYFREQENNIVLSELNNGFTNAEKSIAFFRLSDFGKKLVLNLDK